MRIFNKLFLITIIYLYKNKNIRDIELYKKNAEREQVKSFI